MREIDYSRCRLGLTVGTANAKLEELFDQIRSDPDFGYGENLMIDTRDTFMAGNGVHLVYRDDVNSEVNRSWIMIGTDFGKSVLGGLGDHVDKDTPVPDVAYARTVMALCHELRHGAQLNVYPGKSIGVEPVDDLSRLNLYAIHGPAPVVRMDDVVGRLDDFYDIAEHKGVNVVCTPNADWYHANYGKMPAEIDAIRASVGHADELLRGQFGAAYDESLLVDCLNSYCDGKTRLPMMETATGDFDSVGDAMDWLNHRYEELFTSESAPYPEDTEKSDDMFFRAMGVDVRGTAYADLITGFQTGCVDSQILFMGALQHYAHPNGFEAGTRAYGLSDDVMAFLDEEIESCQDWFDGGMPESREDMAKRVMFWKGEVPLDPEYVRSEAALKAAEEARMQARREEVDAMIREMEARRGGSPQKAASVAEPAVAMSLSRGDGSEVPVWMTRRLPDCPEEPDVSGQPVFGLGV